VALFPVIIDENVPDDIADFFRQHDYAVHLVREQFGAGTPDQVIARAADALHAVIVAWDSDYKRLAGWSSRATTTRYPNMGLIILSGPQHQGLDLIRQHLEDVEFMYQRAQRRTDRRLLIEIGPGGVYVCVPSES
jgi:predicted nuclease of predicted toxin-antitoxin system